MKCQGRERGTIDNRKPCPYEVLVLDVLPHNELRYCGRWDCDVCHKRKTDEVKKWLRDAKLAVTVWVRQEPRVRSKAEEKKVSNLINKKIKRPWWKILSDDNMMIIATKSFPGAARRDTIKVIDSLVPAILSEAWTVVPPAKPKRVQRRPIPPKEKNTGVGAYGEWCGSERDKAKAEIEFRKFENDYQRAVWLIEKRDNGQVKLWERGEMVIADLRLNTCWGG